MVALDQLRDAFPHARINDLLLYLPYLNAGMVRFEINTPNRIAFFLAQAGHESLNFSRVEEMASGKAYEYRKDLGNLKKEALAAAHAKGTTTGRFYKGHGLGQITGYDNHKACGDALGIDLVNKPELLKQPEYAALSACWFWWANGQNKIADSGDFRACTRKYNGGYNGLQDREEKLASVRGALGYV
jgi:putative chitinase